MKAAVQRKLSGRMVEVKIFKHRRGKIKEPKY